MRRKREGRERERERREKVLFWAISGDSAGGIFFSSLLLSRAISIALRRLATNAPLQGCSLCNPEKERSPLSVDGPRRLLSRSGQQPAKTRRNASFTSRRRRRSLDVDPLFFFLFLFPPRVHPLFRENHPREQTLPLTRPSDKRLARKGPTLRPENRGRPTASQPPTRQGRQRGRYKGRGRARAQAPGPRRRCGFARRAREGFIVGKTRRSRGRGRGEVREFFLLFFDFCRRRAVRARKGCLRARRRDLTALGAGAESRRRPSGARRGSLPGLYDTEGRAISSLNVFVFRFSFFISFFQKKKCKKKETKTETSLMFVRCESRQEQRRRGACDERVPHPHF